MISRWIGPFLSALFAGALATRAGVPTSQPAPAPADVPTPQMLRNGSIDPGFLKAHEAFIKQAHSGNIDLLFLGDSITHLWTETGKQVWDSNYASYRSANFAIGGNKTQNLLWEIQNGQLDGIQPRVVVVMIGTNNVNGPVDAICRAETKIVQTIHAKLPATRILLLGILPREYEIDHPYRKTIETVNTQLAKLDDGKTTRFLDMADQFQSPQRKLSLAAYSDFLHLTPEGYRIWATTMRPLLDDMMK